MRIAFIRKRFTPFGGAELYLQRLITTLLTHGHEIHLYATRWITPKRSLHYHRVPIIAGSAFIEALSFAYTVKRMLGHHSYDIVFSFERTLVQDIYRAGDGCHKEWLRRRQAVYPWTKSLFSRLSPLHQVLLFLEKRTFCNSKVVIANSYQVKEEIQQHYHLTAEKIRVIYNDVDLQRFNPANKAGYRKKIREKLNIKDQDMLLLFIGSGFARKGLAFLIKAMATICKNDKLPVKLVIAGKGKIENYIEMARKEGIADHIIYTGPVEQVEELYASSDLFVLPTIYDPFSNACLEALASGIPVVTSLANGAAELLTDQENGYLVKDATDVRALAAAVALFAKSSSKEKMQNKARKSAESLVKRYGNIAIYNDIFDNLR